MKNSEQPAMPAKDVWQESDLAMSGGIYSDFSGLTKREYFAAKAMQGLLANTMVMDVVYKTHITGEKNADKHVAGMAVEYADALLSELESTNQENPQQ